MAYGNYAPFYRGGYFNPMQTSIMPNMAENQGQYVPQYQQQSIQNPIQQTTQQNASWNDMIWVLNENEAVSFPVAPNNSVTLWDKNKNTVYIKSVNMQGVPSIRILDFTERNTELSKNAEKTSTEHICTCGDKFATKEQLNAVEGKINDILAMYDELKEKQTTKTTNKKTKESEE